jgi:hypothetical protein
MSAPGDRLPASMLFAALRARIAATSLRKTAREVGVSPSGLQGMLAGTRTYDQTVRKLHDWYVRYAAREPGPTTAEAAGTAAYLLASHVVLPRRGRAYASALKALASVHDDGELPSWLRKLLDDLPPDDPPPPSR